MLLATTWRKRVKILFVEIHGEISGKFRDRFILFLLSFDNVCERAIRPRLKEARSLFLSFSHLLPSKEILVALSSIVPSEMNLAIEERGRKPASLWKDRF